MFVNSFLIFILFFFFFNDTATTEIYTLSLHDDLPISSSSARSLPSVPTCPRTQCQTISRSEEHTSELQSLTNLVCRLLLENTKKEKVKDKNSRKKKRIRQKKEKTIQT